MNYIIRPYKISDKKQLFILIKHLREYLIPLNPRRKKEINERYYIGLLEKIESEINNIYGCVFVAESKNNIVGYIYGVVREQSDEELEEFIPNKTGEIIDLFVESEYRMNGIGRGLINAIEAFFRDQKCDSISLIVLHNNTYSLGYYSKLNFNKNIIEMVKFLDD